MENRAESNLTGRLSEMADADLLELWSSTMAELRRRGVIRSSNNPTGDYAELIAAGRLGLKLAGNSTEGYDAISDDGKRFQIKGRRLLSPRASRQLSALRGLTTDNFDFLIVVLFGSAFEVQEIWQLPVDLVREHARYQSHVNAHILHARGALLKDPRAVRIH